MDLKQIGWEGVKWIDLAEDRQSTRCCEHSNELIQIYNFTV
jgi:hypothetical protein